MFRNSFDSYTHQPVANALTCCKESLASRPDAILRRSIGGRQGEPPFCHHQNGRRGGVYVDSISPVRPAVLIQKFRSSCTDYRLSGGRNMTERQVGFTSGHGAAIDMRVARHVHKHVISHIIIQSSCSCFSLGL